MSEKDEEKSYSYECMDCSANDFTEYKPSQCPQCGSYDIAVMDEEGNTIS